MHYGEVEAWVTADGEYCHDRCKPADLQESTEDGDGGAVALLNGQDDEHMYGIPDGEPVKCSECGEYLKDDGDDYRKRPLLVRVFKTTGEHDWYETWTLTAAPGQNGWGVREALKVEAARRGLKDGVSVWLEEWEDAPADK